MFNAGRNIIKIPVLMLLSLIILLQPVMAEKNPPLFNGVKKEILSNGLTIITLPRENMPLVSINIFVNTGSINENDETTGISHFCEHLFYRGTEERTGAELKSQIEKLGGMFNAETSKDCTRFFVNIPSAYGLDALKIYCDAVRNANYPKQDIEMERKVILEEYRLTGENPGVILRDRIFRMAFPDHPYGRPIIGTKERLENFQRDDFLRYKKKFYSPENIIFVIVGNFNRNRFVSQIKEYFENIPGGTPIRSADYPLSPTTGPKEETEERPMLLPKAYFVLAYRSPEIKDMDDVLAMDLLVFMLGQGENSILKKEICEDRKLVDDMGADFLTSKNPGLVIFSTQVSVSNVEKLKESLLTVLHDIKKGKFEESDMKKARRLLTRSYIFGNETNEGKADSLGFYEVLSGMDFATGYMDRINALKKEDLVRVANRYFDENYYLYVMKPTEKDGKEKKRR